MTADDRHSAPPPSGPDRPFYYPARWGCLFWIAMFLLVYVLIRLL